MPPTNDGMPGEGSVRRADWFLPIWAERRSRFAGRVAQDQGALVFLGDSITSGFGDDCGGYFPGAKLANRGISGDTTRGVLYRLAEDVISLNPRGVVMLVGTNDLEENATPATAAGNVRLIIDALTAHNPRMPVVLCEVFPSTAEKNRPPSNVKALNALYAGLAVSRPQVTVVGTWSAFANEEGNARVEEFPDLLHPNAAGYAKWAATLRPVLSGLRLIGDV